MVRTSCRFVVTQQSQDRWRWPRWKTSRGGLWGELASFNSTTSLDRQRSLQLVPRLICSEKWQRINEFIWEKLKKSKSWKKILKVVFTLSRPLTWLSFCSKMGRLPSSPTSNTISTSSGHSKATPTTSTDLIRASPVIIQSFSPLKGQGRHQSSRKWGAFGRRKGQG